MTRMILMNFRHFHLLECIHIMKYHNYQHLYAPILFSFMTLLKVFQQDMENILHKYQEYY